MHFFSSANNYSVEVLPIENLKRRPVFSGLKMGKEVDFPCGTLWPKGGNCNKNKTIKVKSVKFWVTLIKEASYSVIFLCPFLCFNPFLLRYVLPSTLSFWQNLTWGLKAASFKKQNLFQQPGDVCQSQLWRSTDRWKVQQYPSQKHAPNSLDSGKTETFWSVLFSVFLRLLICLLSKATGSAIVFIWLSFLCLLRVRKAQVHRQTWVSIKRDFLILDILCTACLVYKYIFKI